MNGTIRKRGKNSWQLIFDLPRDADGKRKQARRTVHGTKRGAETKLRELLAELDKGGYVAPTKESIESFLVRWLDTYAATNTSPRTQRDYRGIVHRYLVPTLGTLTLATLRPDHVQALYADMLARGLSARTVLHAHRVLREALGHAVKWRLISWNVCDAVDPPRPQRKQMTSMDDGEANRFLAVAEASQFKDVFFVALYTGMRRSEILALKWTEVDLERCTLSVVAGLHRLTGQGLVLLPTKTARSRRQVSITDEVVDLLHQIRGQQMVQRLSFGPAWHEAGFVFTKGDGSPLDPEKVTKEFARTAKEAGFSGIRLHDLRHTHASLMLKAGASPKSISERLGHASISITMDVYAHLLPGIQEEAAQTFSKLLADSKHE